MPPEGRYTTEWLHELRDAYNRAFIEWRNKGGEAPAKLLAEQAGVPVRTVHSWIYRARQAGVLPRGRQGQAG